jgi:hypothetical protein
MMMQNKTKLQFLLAGILFVTVSLTACNNDADKNKPAEEPAKTETPAPATGDTTQKKDTMEVTPGKVSPTPEGT